MFEVPRKGKVLCHGYWTGEQTENTTTKLRDGRSETGDSASAQI